MVDPKPLLDVSDLTVSFGGLYANDGIDLQVAEGSFVGLIGPNGAGKTTFIDAITGYVPTSGGTIVFNGEDIASRSAHARARRGLVRTFQSLELFEDLSVEDNLLAAAEPSHWYSFAYDIMRISQVTEGVRERVAWSLDVMGLTSVKDEMPTDLSHGQRKLVGVARALAGSPKLVLLDEPAAGLDTAESQVLGSHLRGFLDHDMSVFLIDHDMGLVLSVCDYIYVLDFGRVIAQGTPTEIRSDANVISAYLGEAAGEAQADSADAVRRMQQEAADD
jgi:branched-chain amino acid transport system ATP-binding protein